MNKVAPDVSPSRVIAAIAFWFIFLGVISIAVSQLGIPALNTFVASHDRVELDGEPLAKQRVAYVLLNKPAGVVTTARDPQGRPTVVGLVDHPARVVPVGRLDADTTGLILLTNDGELANRLTHPSFEVPKTYRAHVEDGPVRAPALRRLREGVELDDGITAPAKVAQPSPGLLRVTIHEGRNRQVRRMGDAIGHRVLRLVRVRIGPISDRTLAPGEWRALTVEEVRSLQEAVKAEDTLP